jgi:glycosyltransferase involved in cell wall biosynthesis
MEEGSSGVLIPIGAISGMAEAIRRLLVDCQRREELADNARRLVHERFSLERMVDETEAVYTQVLSEAVRLAPSR